MRTCEFCSHTFDGPRRKYCFDCLPRYSHATHDEYHRQYRIMYLGLASRLPDRHPARLLKLCADCGAAYFGRTHRCLACAVVRRKQRQRVVHKAWYQTPAGRAYRRSHRKTNSQRVLKRLIGNATIVHCALCRTRVALTRRWPHPRSASVDHILPVAHGGSDDDANLQVVHLECNLSKGDGVWGEGEQLTMQSTA